MSCTIVRRTSALTGEVSYQVKTRLPPDADGKGRSKSKTFRLKRDAIAYKKQVDGEQQQGVYIAESKMTCNQLFDEVIAYYDSPNFAPATLSTRRSHIDIHLRDALGTLRISDIGPKHRRDLVTALEAGGSQPNTVSAIVTTLVVSFNLALEWEYLSRNPVLGSRGGSKGSGRDRGSVMRVLDEEQARSLAKAAKETVDPLPVLLALATGARISEVVGLEWDGVDFKENTLQISQQLLHSKKNGNYFSPYVKTRRSFRTVKVPQTVMDAVAARRDFLHEEFARLGIVDPPQQVCARSDGNLLVSQAVRIAFKGLLAQCKLPDIRFHDLRHTHATLLLRRGKAVHIVSRRLGHANVTTTWNIYSHVIPGDDEDLSDAIGTMIF